MFHTRRNTTYNSVERKRKHAPLAEQDKCYSRVVRSGINPAGIYEELMVRYAGDTKQSTEMYNTMRCHGTVLYSMHAI
jgi:hypothetical protein